MLEFLKGPEVGVPRIVVLGFSTLLLISTCGNLYQTGLLSYSQDNSAANRKLSIKEDADVAKLHDLMESLGMQSSQFIYAALPNKSSSSPSDVPGTAGGSSASSIALSQSQPVLEQSSPRALSDEHSSNTSSTEHSSDTSSTADHSSDTSSAEHSSDKISTEHSSHTSSAEHSTSGSSHASSGSQASGGSIILCEEHAGEHFHQYVALFFLFNILLLGTALLHINAIFPKAQFTVMLFLFGMFASLLLEGVELKCGAGILGESYVMWMDIDPHLLLFAMLPALLAGDAMTIDTSVAKRVSLQCLYLAGPGVVICALLIALFLKFYLEWSFLLGLVTASILCATDPVAVVALLKELGASPILTVQIQGESLLNDGMAIVVYTVAYEMLSGVEYDVPKVLMFLVKTALMACAVGALLGYVFFSWIRAANDRFKHASAVIQILLSLSAAYWSFIMAEGVLHLSGVLATVTSSLVLAHHMWPHCVCKESLHEFWHVMEHMMNIIIFLLAGSLCGAAMVHIEPIDYLHLLVIYVVLTIARGVLIFGSIPLLKHLSYDKQPVSLADAAVMTWGGLRGAVGLALAIQVRRGRAESPTEDGTFMISDTDAQRVLFFVSGIAFLTTTVNATTCPLLVSKLGITAFPKTQEILLKKFTKQLVNHSHMNEHPKEVVDTLTTMFKHIEEEIHEKSEHLPEFHEIKSNPDDALTEALMGRNVWKTFEAVRKVFQKVPKTDLSRVDHPAWSFDDLTKGTEEMKKLLMEGKFNLEMCTVITRTFAGMLQANYEKQIETGDLRPGSPESDLLFTSIHYTLSPLSENLCDFEYIYHSCSHVDDPGLLEAEDVEIVHEESILDDDLMNHYKTKVQSMKWKAKDSAARSYHDLDTTGGVAVNLMGTHLSSMPAVKVKLTGCRAWLDKTVRSNSFSAVCVAAIACNCIFVAVEEGVGRGESASWLVFELMFSVWFTAEAVIKILHAPCAYFKDSWNCFDFFLVIVGIAGGVVSIKEYIIEHDAHSDALSQASKASRVIRIARVLRSMRMLRIFHLLHAYLSRDKRVSKELAVSMLKVSTLSSYIMAHMAAQKQMKKFYLTEGAIEEPEIARCLVQSLTSVHKALFLILQVQRKMDAHILEELLLHKETKRLTEDLENFVQEAEDTGAISSQEAHAIMHPIHHELAACMKFIFKLDDGVVLQNEHSPNHGAHGAHGAHGKEDHQAPPLGNTPKVEEAAVPPEPNDQAGDANPSKTEQGEKFDLYMQTTPEIQPSLLVDETTSVERQDSAAKEQEATQITSNKICNSCLL